MKNIQERTQAGGELHVGKRLAYHTPQLVEFGDLAAHTQANPTAMPGEVKPVDHSG